MAGRDALMRQAGWTDAVPSTLTDPSVKHLLPRPTGERYSAVDGSGKKALLGWGLRLRSGQGNPPALRDRAAGRGTWHRTVLSPRA